MKRESNFILKQKYNNIRFETKHSSSRDSLPFTIKKVGRWFLVFTKSVNLSLIYSYHYIFNTKTSAVPILLQPPLSLKTLIPLQEKSIHRSPQLYNKKQLIFILFVTINIYSSKYNFIKYHTHRKLAETPYFLFEN